MQIAVVGSGYVGLVATACFAEIGHSVVCVDNDTRRIAALRVGSVPIHEAHLRELLERHRLARIRFTSSLVEALQGSRAVFIAVGTPQSHTGEADLSYVGAVASEIGRCISKYTVIVEKSTVPVCTSEWIARVVEQSGGSNNLFDVVSNPEFLREGTAVEDFLHPDRIVVGTEGSKAAAVLDEIYKPLTSGRYYSQPGAISGKCSAEAPPPLLRTSTKSAEIIKHASNAFLAMKISFINAVSNLCEATESDIEQVAQGIGLDSRIGPKFLKPGIGYGGSCFPKDVAAFRALAEQKGVDFSLLAEVEKINRQQKLHFLAKVRSALWTLRGKKIGVLGLAFKGGTDDIRDSPAIDLIEMLLAEGCSVAAYDPAALQRAAAELEPNRRLRFAQSAYEAALGADAVVVLTDWAEFSALDLKQLKTAMWQPILLDGRNLFDPKLMEELGFTYISVGRPAVQRKIVSEVTKLTPSLAS